MENEFNFIHEKLPETDKELFFGPLTSEDKFTTINDNTTWADILVLSKIFESKSQARKNLTNIKGITDLKILSGWSSLSIGKKKVKIHVLNWFE